MPQNSLVIKGDICHSLGARELEYLENGYVVCENGLASGIFSQLPERYAGLPVEDCTGRLVLPGLVDLHVHASQFAYRGTGMDVELLDWLNAYAFPEESRFKDLDYAERAYRRFVDDMRRGPNTRACIFATAHVEATLLLMDMLEESGLVTMVGKVSMDRDAPDDLREADAGAALASVRRWLDCRAGALRAHPAHADAALHTLVLGRAAAGSGRDTAEERSCRYSLTCRRTGARWSWCADCALTAPFMARHTTTPACSAARTATQSWPTACSRRSRNWS